MKLVSNPSKLVRERNFRVYEILCIGNNTRQPTQEPSLEENTAQEPFQETSNNEWLRLTKNCDFTKNDRNEQFSIKILGKDRIYTEGINSLFYAYLFPEL